jgi:hypothetical protein
MKLKKLAALLLSAIMAFALPSSLMATQVSTEAATRSDIRLLEWEEFFELTSDLLTRTTPCSSELDDEFTLPRIIVQTMAHDILLATNPSEYFFRYDGYNVLQYATQKDADAAYEKLSALATGECACDGHTEDKVQWVVRDRLFAFDMPDSEPEEFYDAALSVEASLVAPMSSPFTGYESWGAERMGIPAYAQWLASGNINKDRIHVAIIDTGINFNHPLLQGRRSTIVTPTGPYAVNHQHGVNVGGIVADLTRGFPVYLVDMNIAHGPWGGFTGISNAIRWAAENGVNVINLSNEASHSATICANVNFALNRGVVFVAASGNGGVNISLQGCTTHLRSDGGSIFVSAVQQNDGNPPSMLSNWGPSISMTAAGHQVRVAHWDSRNPESNAAIWGSNGASSIASPHIAAAAALLLLNNPNLTPRQIKDRLISVAEFRNPNAAALTALYNAGTPDLSRLIPTGTETTVGVNPNTLSIEAGQTRTSQVSVSNPSGATTVSSNNTAVATATLSGNTVTVTGVAAGTATISVRNNNVTANIAVTVIAPSAAVITQVGDAIVPIGGTNTAVLANFVGTRGGAPVALQVNGNINFAVPGTYNVNIVPVSGEGSRAATVTVVPNRIYSSDFGWNTSLSTNGWGPIVANSTIGENQQPTGNMIRLRGESGNRDFRKGIATHANSRVVFDIAGEGFTIFRGYAGIDMHATRATAVVVSVLVDGTERHRSSSITQATQAPLIEVNIAGASRVELIAEFTGATNSGAHLSWGDTMFISDESQPPPVFGDVNADGIINAADITLLRRYIAATDKVAFRAAHSTFNLANADVDGNSIIDHNDVALLRLYVAASNPTTVVLGS